MTYDKMRKDIQATANRLFSSAIKTQQAFALKPEWINATAPQAFGLRTRDLVLSLAKMKQAVEELLAIEDWDDDMEDASDALDKVQECGDEVWSIVWNMGEPLIYNYTIDIVDRTATAKKMFGSARRDSSKLHNLVDAALYDMGLWIHPGLPKLRKYGYGNYCYD